MDKGKKAFVALGRRLAGIPDVLTLGVKPNFYDYAEHERDLMLNTNMILYPTRNYAQFFSTMGKEIFPSLETHLYADEKIKQTTLYYMLGIPHPRTRIYYHLHHSDILKDFGFPFVAKLPRASSRGRGVFKIDCCQDLDRYLKLTRVAYIQEYLPHTRDLRVILINYQPVLAYWRECAPGNFRTNIFQGGTIHFDGVPPDILTLAEETARKCHFNDVGLDFINVHEKWYLIEANMKYGRHALEKKEMKLKEIIRDKLYEAYTPSVLTT
jgi:ribosomal protein S6--L-glutamate ligase